MEHKEVKIRIFATFVLSIIVLVLIIIITVKIAKPDVLNAAFLNEQLDTNQYSEIYYVGNFERGKGVVCLAKSEFSEALVQEFIKSFPESPIKSAENIDLIYFVKAGNKYRYRSVQTLPLDSISETPCEPIKIKSSASYGKNKLYYIAFWGEKKDSIELDNKMLPVHSFEVIIENETKTLNFVYYISKGDKNESYGFIRFL